MMTFPALIAMSVSFYLPSRANNTVSVCDMTVMNLPAITTFTLTRWHVTVLLCTAWFFCAAISDALTLGTRLMTPARALSMIMLVSVICGVHTNVHAATTAVALKQFMRIQTALAAANNEWYYAPGLEDCQHDSELSIVYINTSTYATPSMSCPTTSTCTATKITSVIGCCLQTRKEHSHASMYNTHVIQSAAGIIILWCGAIHNVIALALVAMCQHRQLPVNRQALLVNIII